METVLATEPSPRQENEDAVIVGDGFALVLDGASPEPGDSGCQHGVGWYVASLAGRLAALLTGTRTRSAPLAQVLQAAIGHVRGEHGHLCDLDNPRSPSATVAMLRCREDYVDHLVLGDAAVVLGEPHTAVGVVDDRLLTFADVTWSELHRFRNVVDGFWVAATDPEAAHQALTGCTAARRLHRAALLSDGAYRMVERYGWTWQRLLDSLDRDGPSALIARTRQAERATSPGRFSGKHHDDATAVLCRFPAAGSAASRI